MEIEHQLLKISAHTVDVHLFGLKSGQHMRTLSEIWVCVCDRGPFSYALLWAMCVISSENVNKT